MVGFGQLTGLEGTAGVAGTHQVEEIEVIVSLGETFGETQFEFNGHQVEEGEGGNQVSKRRESLSQKRDI